MMEGSIEAQRTGGQVLAFRRPIGRNALAAEAARRLERIGYGSYAARERVTGLPVPPAILYLKLQIEFAAERLKRLDPLPENFRSDIFWPS